MTDDAQAPSDRGAQALYVVRQMVEAFDSGNLQMNSPEIGEPENDIPYHPWHEQLLYYARLALEPASGSDSAAAKAPDLETIQTLLDLLNPLHGELDRQTYDAKVAMDFDTPPDYEHDVVVSAQMERDLTQAVLILENRRASVVSSTHHRRPDETGEEYEARVGLLKLPSQQGKTQ